MSASLSRARSHVRTTVTELSADGRGRILLAVSSGWALSIGIRFVFSPLVPYLRGEFGFSLATTGVLLTLLWGSYALGHVPGGIIGDRIGEGRILLASTVIATAMVLIISSSVTVWMLFTGAIAYGLATGMYGPTRFTILTNVYPERAGSAIGLTMAAGSAGNAFFPVVATAIAAATSWRLGFGVFVPAFAAVAVAVWLTVPARTSGSDSAVDSLSAATLQRIWTGIVRGEVLSTVSVQMCISFIMQGFAAFYPAYLASEKGLSPSVAAMLFGLFFFLGALIQPVAGGIQDRFGARPTLIGFLTFTVVALWLLPVTMGLLSLIGLTAMLSTWNGCVVVTQTYIANSLPPDMQGTGMGTLKAIWMLVGATAPLLVGSLADFGFFDAGFFALAAVGTVGLGLTLLKL